MQRTTVTVTREYDGFQNLVKEVTETIVDDNYSPSVKVEIQSDGRAKERAEKLINAAYPLEHGTRLRGC